MDSFKIIFSIILGIIFGLLSGYFLINKFKKPVKGPDSSIIRKKTYYLEDDVGNKHCYKFKPIPVVGPIISRHRINYKKTGFH